MYQCCWNKSAVRNYGHVMAASINRQGSEKTWLCFTTWCVLLPNKDCSTSAIEKKRSNVWLVRRVVYVPISNTFHKEVRKGQLKTGRVLKKTPVRNIPVNRWFANVFIYFYTSSQHFGIEGVMRVILVVSMLNHPSAGLLHLVLRSTQSSPSALHTRN